MKVFDDWMEKQGYYVCGAPLAPDGHPMHTLASTPNKLVVSVELSCGQPMQKAYYSARGLSLPSLCFHCGTKDDLVEPTAEEKSRTVVFPICSECLGAGKKRCVGGKESHVQPKHVSGLPSAVGGRGQMEPAVASVQSSSSPPAAIVSDNSAAARDPPDEEAPRAQRPEPVQPVVAQSPVAVDVGSSDDIGIGVHVAQQLKRRTRDRRVHFRKRGKSAHSHQLPSLTQLAECAESQRRRK